MIVVQKRAGAILTQVLLGLTLIGFITAGPTLLSVARCDEIVKGAEPNPRALLNAVASARKNLSSGNIEFDVSQYHSALPLDGTNHIKMKVSFEGSKRHVETFAREYSYTLMGPGAADVTERKRRELSLGREAAVAKGLLESHETHNVGIFDGTRVMSVSSKQGQPTNARIGDSPRSTSLYLIDPRTLGLRPSLSFTDTIESCLEHNKAESVELVGKAVISGAPTWHVRVSNSGTWPIYDYWINTTNTAWLIRQEFNGNSVTAEFNRNDVNDPLPVVVRVANFYTKERVRVDTQFVRRSARFNIPVDSTLWRLEGLKMPVGTEVVDSGTGRMLGYWHASGLSSERPVELVKSESPAAPNIAGLLDLAKKDPKSSFAAHAYLTAATLLKRYALAACSERATADAERLFEQLLVDFGQTPWEGTNLAEQIQPELSELRRVGIGKIAPDIHGEDLNGRRIKLSDYRGKIVVLTFWGSWCPPCMALIPEENRLAERMAGQPFALIGVNSDNDGDTAKLAMRKMNVTWPSFRDGKPGPIARDWHVRIWPDTFVLDADGVIRFRNRRGKDLHTAVDALVKELHQAR